MKPEEKSRSLLGVTRSKAKMLEYGIPEIYHITTLQEPSKLFSLSIAILGDLVALTNRSDANANALSELRRNLVFSAYFFDAFLESELNVDVNPYLLLLGSAAYYLCALPGASSVLSKRLGSECPNMDAGTLEYLLHWLLQGDLSEQFEGNEGRFGRFLDSISQGMVQFFQNGIGIERLLVAGKELRATAYGIGSPRELLLADIIAAIISTKFENSCWYALAQYSGLGAEAWRSVIQKDSFPRELWPSQHLLGRAGVFRGTSAVIQMPTSAGKTRATELIIRSAFLAGRTSLAIIVAPFRALCHEIRNSLHSAFQNEAVNVNELSDVTQSDFEISELLGSKQVVVVTPEKLLYVLRHERDLAEDVGLVIYDEGHQFDSGSRGITYELLLTSLQSLLPAGAQKILISAVISNAKALGDWLNGENSEIVTGTDLTPTLRSVGFASWQDYLGRIEFVQAENPEKNEYFVPRVMESTKLSAKPRERVDRFFPEKSDGHSIALYLGLKLVKNGGVAIFVGRKDTAAGVCAQALEVFERGLSLELPRVFSDAGETGKLKYLYEANLGSQATATQSAELGIFSHHGNTPHGIRLSVEHAMREGLIRFVVCTSTLAQGVNLPIRYLILTGVYQGEVRIKVRDFHNLIGRAGRAGMHTEGSILFAEPDLYDNRASAEGRWRWGEIKKLLEARNSEPCISSLLSLFEPIKSDNGKIPLKMGELDFARFYINEPGQLIMLAENIARQGAGFFSRDGVQRQISEKIKLICSVESFLLSNWDTDRGIATQEDILHLAEGTLAFFMADEEKRALIRELFKLLAENISRSIPERDRRIVYGRTLYGVRDGQAIEAWVRSNMSDLSRCNSAEEILECVWSLLYENVHNNTFKKCDKPAALKEVAREWLNGRPFYVLLGVLKQQKARMIWGTKRREFNIDQVVEICESGLSYDGALLIGAVCEFIGLLDPYNGQKIVEQLNVFQKLLKYGLPNSASVTLYELGFADRVVAMDLASSEGLVDERQKAVRRSIRSNENRVTQTMEKYPSYFRERLFNILS